MSLIGVAISTTADPHRMSFLETSVRLWTKALPEDSVLVVTVDGDEAALNRTNDLLNKVGVSTLAIRVGQGKQNAEGRSGVAVNKNTGLEALMAHSAVGHIFLSDDDTAPRSFAALKLHGAINEHTVVGWGTHRLRGTVAGKADWTWPRGAVMYVTRDMVERAGGLIEEFGPGGHEHVEWSERLFKFGFSRRPFQSPAEYANNRGHGARVYWYAEDMRQHGETSTELDRRRRQHTSVRTRVNDWYQIEQVREKYLGHHEFVPYTAEGNGRAPATI